MLSAQTMAIILPLNKHSVWDYYHFDFQLNLLTLNERSHVKCVMIFKSLYDTFYMLTMHTTLTRIIVSKL